MTPRKFGIPSTIYRKAMKLESSNLVCGYNMALPSIWNCKISEKRRGLGHVTPRIFGIPSSIPPTLVKLDSSKLVHGFILAPPTSLKHNISERGVALVT